MRTACTSAATWCAPTCRRCYEPLVPSDPGAEETRAMRTTILAYIIAVVGLVMLTFGAWGLFVLNTAGIDIALTDEAIVFGLIGGGLAMIGVAQALRLLLVIEKNTSQALAFH